MKKKVKSTRIPKYVYLFGGGKADGNERMKELLGGKGANLAEMAGHKDLKLPVPAGFTITTEVCTYFYKNNRKYPTGLKEQVEAGLRYIESIMEKKFGDPENPLLVSVRSGARRSMPGMMETVLNIGLNDQTAVGLIKQTNNPRFVYDAYRRLIQMYADVVMEKAEGIEPEEGKGVRQQLEKELEKMKQKKGVKLDTDLTAEDLKELVKIYKKKVKEVLGKEFPEDPYEQLWGGIRAVFLSWNGKRAVAYRRIEGIPDDWGTAVNVQAMVFGNMGEDSGTGVGFTRNPATGENKFYGEWLPNAQGEDVVAGIRTPYPVNEYSRTEHSKGLPSLEKQFPSIYKQLEDICKRLEKHYRDMLDIEFTIERGKLWMLQCRVGKRNGPAAVRMAVEMYKEKLISAEEAVMRVSPTQLDEVLHPIVDPIKEKEAKLLAKGLPAGPGGAVGKVVFTANDAVEWTKKGEQVILVREETNPEDVEGMRAAVGILTARGGMTSHAALVARGWGKCCIVGAGDIHIDYEKKVFRVKDIVVKEGDWITLNGTKGNVYLGQIPLVKAAEDNPFFMEFIKICNKVRKLGVRTNADTPQDAKKARMFGAEGIGLFRTEHMFYGEGSDKPLFILRKMIVSTNEEERRKALDELFPYMKEDIKKTLDVMEGLPVTIRLLDPPLHEFVPKRKDEREKLIQDLGITEEEFEKRTAKLHEVNPMMGHRGVRLGISYPEITEYQVRAILEAAAELVKEGKKAMPEIMIPVTSTEKEIINQKEIIDKVYQEVIIKFKIDRKKLPLVVGTMIEIPRACIVADKLAEVSEFFSFGTNDLTQMGFGFSRDDIGGFLPKYLEKDLLPKDPFQTVDFEGIGELIKIGIAKGRKVKPKLKIGICGEHGGDPESVKFCYKIGMDYVSCSPYRVPLAILAAAQAVVEEKKKK
ncbi:MAG: pyruvate, phosphate dikinase [Endomicrobia bacterium]|nr:pyruvate, phosphate dikinase [Endomicrobiia bacterium]MDW8055851.1 pyruvate, phosphate dikinase [Elusimicrobiota bacterium]